MIRSHAVGIVAKDRWNLTLKTLQSLYHTDEPKDRYDLYIIDNGSSRSAERALKEWVYGKLIPVKNLVRTKHLPIGAAWNLFLDIAKDYDYRTKLDNDLIFANTPVTIGETEKREGKSSRAPSPADSGTNPGATPVASFIVGAGQKTVKRVARHTCFLQHLENALIEKKLAIAALAPVSVGVTLPQALPLLGEKTWRGQPYLLGACMTITVETFDQLGYFDEHLPMAIDKEYTQRAMAHGLNVGYVEDYCVIHAGESTPTCTDDVLQNNKWKLKQIETSLPFQRVYVHSKWEQVSDKIAKATASSLIVNLSS